MKGRQRSRGHSKCVLFLGFIPELSGFDDGRLLSLSRSSFLALASSSSGLGPRHYFELRRGIREVTRQPLARVGIRGCVCYLTPRWRSRTTLTPCRRAICCFGFSRLWRCPVSATCTHSCSRMTEYGTHNSFVTLMASDEMQIVFLP